MIDPKKQAEFDQAEEYLVQQLPKLWFRMYRQLVSEGFLPSEAMQVLTAYIRASFVQRSE